MNEASEEETKDNNETDKNDPLNIDLDSLSPGTALNDDFWPENEGPLPGEPG